MKLRILFLLLGLVAIFLFSIVLINLLDKNDPNITELKHIPKRIQSIKVDISEHVMVSEDHKYYIVNRQNGAVYKTTLEDYLREHSCFEYEVYLKETVNHDDTVEVVGIVKCINLVKEKNER